MRLTHVRLLVDDFGACFRFYRDVMGFRPTLGAEDEAYASFAAGDVALALFDRDYMSDAVGTRDLPFHAPCQDRAALIFEVESVDNVYAELAGRGASFLKRPDDFAEWGLRAVHLRDPDGNLIELNSSLPA